MADNLQRIRYHHIFLTVSISIVDLWRQRLYHFAKLSLAGKRLSAILKMQHHHFHHNNNEAEKQNPFWRYSNAAHSGFRITKLSRSFQMISSYNCSNIMKLSRLLQNETFYVPLPASSPLSSWCLPRRAAEPGLQPCSPKVRTTQRPAEGMSSRTFFDIVRIDHQFHDLWFSYF